MRLFAASIMLLSATRFQIEEEEEEEEDDDGEALDILRLVCLLGMKDGRVCQV